MVYVYDDHDNWIRRETFKHNSDTLDIVEKRVIQYYPPIKSAPAMSATETLPGIWKEVNGRKWIDFKKGHTYDQGTNENIEDMGTYEYNSEDGILSLFSKKDDNSKKYRIRIKDRQMTLSSITGNEEWIYEKEL